MQSSKTRLEFFKGVECVQVGRDLGEKDSKIYGSLEMGL